MAVEVQRMRERLVNLGIAVAEIAHQGENAGIHNTGDEDYLVPPNSSDLLQANTSNATTKHEATCMSVPTSGRAGAYSVTEKALRSSPGRVADETDSFRIEMTTTDASTKSSKGLSECSLVGLDPVAHSLMGSPQTPAKSFSLRITDGQEIDICKINAKEEPGGERKQTLAERAVLCLPSIPRARLECLEMEAGVANLKEKMNDKELIRCQGQYLVTETSKNVVYQVEDHIEEQVLDLNFFTTSKQLTNSLPKVVTKTEDKMEKDQGVTYEGSSPCDSIDSTQARVANIANTRRKTHPREGFQIESFSARVRQSQTRALGRGASGTERDFEDIEGGIQHERQGLHESSSNIEPKVSDIGRSILLFSPFRDPNVRVKCSGISTFQSKEKCAEDMMTGFQSDKQTKRAPVLNGRYTNIGSSETSGTCTCHRTFPTMIIPI